MVLLSENREYNIEHGFREMEKETKEERRELEQIFQYLKFRLDFKNSRWPT